MPVVLLAHMGTPLLAGFVVLGMVMLAKPGVPDWFDANDAALDMTILSIGATGPLLLEPQLRQSLDASMAVYGILLVLVNMLLACVLVSRKKWKKNHAMSFANVWPDFLLGVISMGITTGMFYIAYSVKGAAHVA